MEWAVQKRNEQWIEFLPYTDIGGFNIGNYGGTYVYLTHETLIKAFMSFQW